MTQISSYKLGIDYSKFGINPNELGCVMIDTESPMGYANPDVLDYLKEREYKSENLKYVQGLCEEFHATVRYGFLPGVKKADFDFIMKQAALFNDSFWNLRLGVVEVWPSINGEDYECVIVRVIDDELHRWHRIFGLLPNISTFSEYKPHITIGYFKPGTWAELELGDELIKWNVKVKKLRFNSVLLSE